MHHFDPKTVISQSTVTLLAIVMSFLPTSYTWAQDRAKPLVPFSIDGPMPSYGQWVSSKLGGGGYIQNVVLCPSDANRAYAYVDVGGLYRSDDGGRNWRMLHGALPARMGCYEVRSLTVDPRDADRVLIAVGSQWQAEPEGIYSSTDGGTSWKQTLTAKFAGNGDHRWTGVLLARDAANPDLIVVATLGDGIHQSLDNGSTWVRADSTDGISFTDIKLDRTSSGKGWACAVRWDNWLGGKPGVKLAGGFYATVDHGITWSKISEEPISEILQDPIETNRLYACSSDGTSIRVSTDSGVSWSDGSSGLSLLTPGEARSDDYTSDKRYQAMAAGPDFIVTASTKGTFYKRLAAGDVKTPWQKIERKAVQEGDWFAAMGEGKWQHFGSALASITIDPENPSRWFFTDWFAIYQSTDAGLNWTLTIDGIEVTVIHRVLGDPHDPNVVHMGMADNGYFRSSNGAGSFKRPAIAGVNSNTKDIALSIKDSTRVYVVAPKPEQIGQWLANQVYVSTDRGENWSAAPVIGLPDMSAARCNSITVSTDDPKTVYLAVSGAVSPNQGGPYRSLDGGITWQWIGSGLPTGELLFREPIFDTGHEIVAGADNTLVAISRITRRAYRFDNKSGVWIASEKPFAGEPFEVRADGLVPGRIFAGVTGVGVCRSIDGGATWQVVYPGGASYIAVDSVMPGRVAASTPSGVILSTDGGDTWTPLDDALPDKAGRNPISFAGNRLVVGSGGSGVFYTDLTRLK